MNTGIYAIQNTITGDQYIGQTTDFKARKRVHFQLLSVGRHINRHLQGAYNKYGGDNFEFVPLLYCEYFELTRYEQGLVDRLKPRYNICRECVNSTLGVFPSEETRLKLSLGKKGRPWSDEYKKHMSEVTKGRKFSVEHRKRLSLSQAGKARCIKSEETRRKLSEALMGHVGWNKGGHISEETRRKISESHKGLIPWNKGKTYKKKEKQNGNVI